MQNKITTPAQRRQALKDRLIDLAGAMIDAHGIEGLRARELAKSANCALGAIYNVVADLDALILEVNWRTLASFEEYLVDANIGREPRDATEELAHIALLYLEFAARNPHRWRALFEHRMANGTGRPDWYIAAQSHLFAHLEPPLRSLRPGLRMESYVVLARSVFSAIHGMVALGLDEKFILMPLPLLREQIRVVTLAMAQGLDARMTSHVK